MYIHVRIFPNQKDEIVRKVKDDTYEIKVREKAERNQANKRMLELVRNEFPNARDIKIVNGHHSPSKLLAVNLNDE